VKAQERRRLEDDRDPPDSPLAEEERPETKEESIERGKGRSPMARPGDDQELLFQENALGNDGTRAARPEEPGDRRQEVSKQEEKGAHAGRDWDTMAFRASRANR
jgi:hypothetical protein